MVDYRKHIILSNTPIKAALAQLNELAADAILFVVNEEEKLLGSLTDGDVRRGFLKGLTLNDVVNEFIQPNPKFLQRGSYTIDEVISYRKNNFKIIPVLCKDGKIVNIINFRFLKSYLPVDAVLMAGGRGERLKPLTDDTPKPLLKVGKKPIIEHNIDRLISYGIDDVWISVRYLGEQLEGYFKDGSSKFINVKYVWEDEPLGTLGAVSKIEDFQHEYILVTNSDLLTNLDYEDFFLHFQENDAALSVVTIPYTVNVPYAVLETENNSIKSFKEKPTYTYYSNGGIYLLKKEVLNYIPKNSFYNTTDLMELLISKGLKVTSYPLRGYWLDIGQHEDYKKAQEDIHHIKF
ncbi:nucleotidyltransferase family protein [Pontibacter ramchanderi]|uniref:Nucleotidyltransferase-like protein n=1 Tax=Pontibacter ramchanderi TaxID=1179743 RepID=A0A2N3U907_9BACT|nr:nucleotidyltransferase family protein [Pontibacter ramchanderi]PKV63227.1 nucleotidyltransferase-like protein [Pontibacter ramchanderi]